MTPTLLERMNTAIRLAQHAKNTTALNTYRAIKCAIEIVEKSGKVVDELAILRTQVKRRMDSIDMFYKGGRPELADAERAELALIEALLPTPPSLEEVNRAIVCALAELGEMSPNKGAVIKRAKEILGPNADGATVAKQVSLHL